MSLDCPLGSIKCPGERGCIPTSYLCDRQPDCRQQINGTAFDEINCSK